ncbi:hypothetical protein DCAR_0623005 [Daucus carota subsp. sativus]|uniref:BRISC and BRCA1-A complex member 2 n=1 Tax=Daucus carota subsp. sativus TaxID=79200 RepID=A0A161ZPX2_DAUCS|nr:PREDICTED: BRCA1-A complex subunit BRE [Daucus carota subsp. sativus]WOH03606.1 hypothetical protein DCAR_0623005 [Daucus carota subsp. sativus]
MAVDTIPPLINAQLNYLRSNAPFSIKVEQMWSGCRNPSLIDRFTLAIPFCLDYIKWDVIYNAQNPLAAPDVIFGPEDEAFHPFRGMREESLSNSKKNCLLEWNYKDPACLLTLILQLRDLYMVYQKQRVGEVDDERLKFELGTIISKEGLEMYMSSGVEKPEEVRFAVPLLGMDINKIVIGSSWRQQQKIYLQVIFPVVGKFTNKPPVPRLKLVSTPDLRAVLSVEDVRLLPWSDGMCLAEYLPTLEELLASQIKDAVTLIELRRQFIVALAPFFGRPLEADSVFCRKASFLSVSGIFTFVVHFALTLQFPKQPPLLVLQSSQHFDLRGAAIKSSSLTEYPWSPRWDVSEMAERIFDFVADECLNFRKICNESVHQQQR